LEQTIFAIQAEEEPKLAFFWILRAIPFSYDLGSRNA
jgi:hypothetical protein